ncbi:hypothetical protein VEE13_44960 (plasmid) [Escherichia coli]|nr:hypothetical protein VEE13_44960 [Escherichia coli]
MYMIDYMFWIGVVLWSTVIVMWFYDNKVSCSGLFALSIFIFSGGVMIMLFLISFLYGVISALGLAV